MFGLLQWFFQKLDLVRAAEFIKTRNNREAAAKLYYILVVLYEIIDIYEILLDELKAHLSAHKDESAPRFWVNPARFARLLMIQADNLEKVQSLSNQLYTQLRVLHKDFASVVKEIFSGKFPVLFSLTSLLSEARLPTKDFSRRVTDQPSYHTLWFTWEPPSGDRSEIEKYLHGYTGEDKVIIDVNTHDGEEFIRELERYLREEQPFEALSKLRAIADELKNTLQSTFDIKDVVADLGKVKVRRNWASK